MRHISSGLGYVSRRIQKRWLRLPTPVSTTSGRDRTAHGLSDSESLIPGCVFLDDGITDRLPTLRSGGSIDERFEREMGECVI
jgi:hypothetical protein